MTQPRMVRSDPGRGRNRHPSTRERDYLRARRRWSDVKDHLPRFVDAVVSREARVVVELGTRGGVSTAAWLYALAMTGGHLWTVDLSPAPRLSSDEGAWTHVVGDDLDPDVYHALPPVIDVLFIDTSHDYDQTLSELALYVPRVRPGGVVLLHDTDLATPEGVKEQEPYPVRRAIDVFCAATGLDWTEHDGSYGLGEIPVP